MRMAASRRCRHAIRHALEVPPQRCPNSGGRFDSQSGIVYPVGQSCFRIRCVGAIGLGKQAGRISVTGRHAE